MIQVVETAHQAQSSDPAVIHGVMQLADAHATMLGAVLGIAAAQAKLDASEALGAARGMRLALASLRALLASGSLAVQVVETLDSYASSVVGGVELACQGVHRVDLAGLSRTVQALALSVRSLQGLSVGLGILSKVATKPVPAEQEAASLHEDAS